MARTTPKDNVPDRAKSTTTHNDRRRRVVMHVDADGEAALGKGPDDKAADGESSREHNHHGGYSCDLERPTHGQSLHARSYPLFGGLVGAAAMMRRHAGSPLLPSNQCLGRPTCSLRGTRTPVGDRRAIAIVPSCPLAPGGTHVSILPAYFVQSHWVFKAT
jgi:hypothetical protein